MGELIGYDELEKEFDVDRRTIQRWVRSRGFPRGVELTPGTIRYYREEVKAWVRERAAKRGRLPLSEKDVFEQLNAVLTEAHQTGDFALEMAELNEKFKGEDDAYVPGPVTLNRLLGAYLRCRCDPDTADATRDAVKRRPELAGWLEARIGSN